MSTPSGFEASSDPSGLDSVAAFLIDQVGLAGLNSADQDRMQDLLFAYLQTTPAPEFCSR
jgi:hypothetical protein